MEGPFNWDEDQFEDEDSLMAKLSPHAALAIALSSFGALSSLGHVFYQDWRDEAVAILYKFMRMEGNNKLCRDLMEIASLATALTHRILEEEGVKPKDIRTGENVDQEEHTTPDGVLRSVANSYPGEEYTEAAMAQLKLKLYGTDGVPPPNSISDTEAKELEDHFNMNDAEEGEDVN